ncbi:hypothetical protein E5D57_002167 [Metarhizium anisopliae]|nr:hypothetical protein E5D57_002167 [Metarhizium anisopliae]
MLYPGLLLVPQRYVSFYGEMLSIHSHKILGWFYLFNPENEKAGGNGCEPPWGFMGKTLREYPGFCSKKLGCDKV